MSETCHGPRFSRSWHVRSRPRSAPHRPIGAVGLRWTGVARAERKFSGLVRSLDLLLSHRPVVDRGELPLAGGGLPPAAGDDLVLGRRADRCADGPRAKVAEDLVRSADLSDVNNRAV